MPQVIGAIREKWIAVGGERGFGAPLDDERPTWDGVGRAQEFQGGGTISWHPDLGASAIWGRIRQRWFELGREETGYPITDETGAADGRGRFNHFRDRRQSDWSIYWTPQTGAHEVYGGIRDSWAKQGWESGSLGYPVDPEHDGPGGKREQNFERGRIAWNGGASNLPPETVHPTIQLQDLQSAIDLSGTGFSRSNEVVIDYRYGVNTGGPTTTANGEIIAMTDINGNFTGARFELNSVEAVNIAVRATDFVRQVWDERFLRGGA
jgi:hypothetical protein